MSDGCEVGLLGKEYGREARIVGTILRGIEASRAIVVNYSMK
jgi:hypothetical protein